MAIKITGEMDGQPIWREETSYDKLARWAEEEHKKHLDRMAGVDDETKQKVEIGGDDIRDNNEDR